MGTSVYLCDMKCKTGTLEALLIKPHSLAPDEMTLPILAEADAHSKENRLSLAGFAPHSFMTVVQK